MWLKPQGYATITTPEPSKVNLDGFQHDEIREGVAEYDSLTCGHCRRIVHVKARTRPEDIGGMCSSCWRAICPSCVDKPCMPWEKRLEEEELRDRILRERAVAEYR